MSPLDPIIALNVDPAFSNTTTPYHGDVGDSYPLCGNLPSELSPWVSNSSKSVGTWRPFRRRDQFNTYAIVAPAVVILLLIIM